MVCVYRVRSYPIEFDGAYMVFRNFALHVRVTLKISFSRTAFIGNQPVPWNKTNRWVASGQDCYPATAFLGVACRQRTTFGTTCARYAHATNTKQGLKRQLPETICFREYLAWSG